VEPRAETARASVRTLAGGVERFTDPDAALEWAETELLRRHGFLDELPEGLVPLAQQDLLHGLSADVVAEIEARTTTHVFPAGTVLFEEGAVADGLYFIGAGQVSADVRTRTGARRRLSTIAAGSAFGELAIVDGKPRSTRICAELTLAIARSLSQRLRYSTADVAAFEET
jgi:glutaminase